MTAHYDADHGISVAAGRADACTYTVTVQLRSGEKIERKWTAAVDATDAIELTLKHLTSDEADRVQRVFVVEAKTALDHFIADVEATLDPLDDAIEAEGGRTWL